MKKENRIAELESLFGFVHELVMDKLSSKIFEKFKNSGVYCDEIINSAYDMVAISMVKDICYIAENHKEILQEISNGKKSVKYAH